MEHLYIAALLVVGTALFIMFYLNRKSSTDGSRAQFGQQSTSTAQAHKVQNLAPRLYQSEFSAAGQPHTLVDVRTPEEFASGHIHGAQNIALQELPARWGQLPKDRPLVLYCRTGNRSGMAGKMALQEGFTEVYNLGGVVEWHKQGLPLE
jgi:phage shock protein E